jgi:hypothetical protein
VLSRDGQDQVAGEGDFFALPAEVADRERRHLDAPAPVLPLGKP